MLQVLLTGLANGSIYGIVAMAYAVVYYVTRVINFATGQLMMLSIMVTTEMSLHGASVPLSLLVGVGATTLCTVMVYFIAVKPIIRLNRFNFAWLVSTLGIGIIIESGAAYFWGVNSLPFPNLLNTKDVKVLGGFLTWQQIVSILISIVVLIGFEIARKKTLFGKIAMAISADPEIASATGANVASYAVWVFIISGLLLSLAGILIGPISFADAYLGETFGISGFVALMIGGIESPAAAMAGGWVLGILESFAVTYVNAQSSSWFPFVVVVAVLLVKPTGLFVNGAGYKGVLGRIFAPSRKVRV